MEDKFYSVVEEVNNLLSQGRVVKPDVLEKIKEKTESINTFIEKNKDSKDLTEEQKDEVYAESTKIWNDYTSYIKDITYYVDLTGEEYHYVRDLVQKDREYTEKDILIGWKLQENFFQVTDELMDIKRESKLYNIAINISSVSLLHQMLQTESVKGLLSKKAMHYKSMLEKIGGVYKIFGIWNDESKILSEKIINWTQGLQGKEETLQPVNVANGATINA